MINKVILLGRIGKEPEIKDLTASKVANLSIATTTSWKDKSGKKQEQTKLFLEYFKDFSNVEIVNQEEANKEEFVSKVINEFSL